MVISLFLICLVCFGLLTRMANLQHLLSLDTTINGDVQRYNFGLLKPIMIFISLPGKTVFAGASILSVAGLFWWKRYHREAFFILMVGGADLLSLIIKHFVNRPGPEQLLSPNTTQAPEPTYPSSHVVHYVVFFGLLTYFMLILDKLPGKPRAVVALIGIFLIITIPFSRVLLTQHWLSDVVGGLFLGAICLIIFIWLNSALWFLPQLKSRSTVLDD